MKADFVGGRLTFGSDLKERGECFFQFEVRDRTSGQVVWAIAEKRETNPPELSECKGQFPLEYGKAPAGFETSVAPAKLLSGHSYSIDGSNGNPLYGKFLYTVIERIENVE
ncbi:hypothetical protein [Sphingomonas sp. R647]|uniref:hypothetical protein n=1 Tax=Sphingomonas sp. R647 TaxID=2875233 RepID=UPI001CD43D8C|nr:hypothetical protein [Sphingomonas sp. R647]